jgi:hypothetical protein
MVDEESSTDPLFWLNQRSRTLGVYAREAEPEQLDVDDELQSWEDWFASLPPTPPVDDEEEPTT